MFVVSFPMTSTTIRPGLPAVCVCEKQSSCHAKHAVMPIFTYLLCLLCLRLDLATSLDALQNVLTVLVELQLGDDDL